MLDVQVNDVCVLDTGEYVIATDVAEAPETLFVYRHIDSPDLHVTDRSFVARNVSAEASAAA